MARICATLVVVGAVVAAGCGGAAGADSPAPAATTLAAATTTLAAAPKPCTSTEVRSLVDGFVEAFNEGDLVRLDGLFAPGRTFKWYSTNGPGARLNDAAYDRETLIHYFERRHEGGEQLELRSFKFNGNSAGYGHFEYGLVRSADDLAPTNYDGKGAAICTPKADVIAVWSMGRQ
jgi:hypothetical protein